MEETAVVNKKEENSREESPKPTSQKEKLKLTKKHFIITIVAGILAVILVGALVYFWQLSNLNQRTETLNTDKKELSDKISSQSAQIKEMKKTTSDQKSRITFLEKSLQEATASAQFEFGELSFSGVRAKSYNFDNEGVEKNLVLIDITIKNETDQTLFLSLSSLKLKDTNNKSYPIPQNMADLLPTGKVALFDQQVARGETITGTVAFDAPKSINLFTLFIDNQQFTLTLD